MGIRVHKAGLLDTIQDAGRYGYQHWGINPGGAMDIIAMKIANMLVGNKPDEPVIELHFPASELVFEETALIAIAGADFEMIIDNMRLSPHQPAIVKPGSVLKCRQHAGGAHAYLAVAGGISADEWLGSYSTQLKVKAGGCQGRALKKDDVIVIKQQASIVAEANKLLPWRADVQDLYQQQQEIFFIPGAEYDWLTDESRQQLQEASFMVGRSSDRMGYRMQGAALAISNKTELISSAVTRGTMQLLPDGQLIILMADHQATGGYPRVGHIITVHFPSLAQAMPGTELRFLKTNIVTAEALLLNQQRNLQQLQNACTLRLEAIGINNANQGLKRRIP